MLHSLFFYFISSLARSKYLSLFSLSFKFTLWCPGTVKFTNLQFLFLLTIATSGRLANIKWLVLVSRSQRMLCASFSRTDSRLCLYHFFVSSKHKWSEQVYSKEMYYHGYYSWLWWFHRTKYSENVQADKNLPKPLEKINHIMFMDDIKLFAKNKIKKRSGYSNTRNENIQWGDWGRIWHKNGPCL